MKQQILESTAPSIETMVYNIRALYFPNLKNKKIEICMYKGPIFLLFDLSYASIFVVSSIPSDHPIYQYVKNIQDCNYLITISKDLFNQLNNDFKEKLLRHELRHCSPNEDIIIPHDNGYRDFIIEKNINKGDSSWAKDLDYIWVKTFSNVLEDNSFIEIMSSCRGISVEYFKHHFGIWMEQVLEKYRSNFR